MLRLLVQAIRKYVNDCGPSTRLGRWCGPWYNPDCQPMIKGGHADNDNSFATGNVKPSKEEVNATRDPVSVFRED